MSYLSLQILKFNFNFNFKKTFLTQPFTKFSIFIKEGWLFFIIKSLIYNILNY